MSHRRPLEESLTLSSYDSIKFSPLSDEVGFVMDLPSDDGDSGFVKEDPLEEIPDSISDDDFTYLNNDSSYDSECSDSGDSSDGDSDDDITYFKSIGLLDEDEDIYCDDVIKERQ